MSPVGPGGVIITGGAGLLGTALVRASPPGTDVAVTVRTRPASPGVPSHRVELAAAGAFGALVDALRPATVIHTAYGMADLDRDVVEATRQVVDACAAHDVSLIHCSSDVVFDGELGPYDERRSPAPVSAYGTAKARAERIVGDALADAAIIRTSLLIQSAPPDPASAWVIDSNRRGDVATLFSDEFRCPVSVDDVADGIWRIAALGVADRGGVWHLVGRERLSRVELGDLLAARFGLDRSLLVPTLSSSVPGPRPRDLTLSCARGEAAIGWAPRTVSEVLGRDAGRPERHR